ncbi:dickkopf-related protein 3b isoform X1 [Anarrhichthys ocellatus]|uniref:dickkopf-related protein 3b isoform X1 n=1 Tax=Anarrhichthys ocellatus TaxID=433405 RepID=UPI0012EDFAAE|nr:dickkopf-related protein 3-like isoform X1 [Anarrhichthys ocellatus]
MSAIMLLLVSLSLCLWATDGATRGEAVDLRDALERGPVSLNDMFREVEELMEDTQHILEEAVDQITTESAKSSLTSLDLRTNYHNETKKMMTEGDRVVQVLDGADKECMVDEDCGHLKYCLYEIENSKCLPCIPTDMPCTKDEECCSDQMCVWGQCTVNATKGTEGSICQGQSDCKADLCCAFQRELLFPVCNPKPEKGESCLSHPNLLMDMLAWDQEGPRDHCSCADDLQCQPHGRGSVCGE